MGRIQFNIQSLKNRTIANNTLPLNNDELSENILFLMENKTNLIKSKEHLGATF